MVELYSKRSTKHHLITNCLEDLCKNEPLSEWRSILSFWAEKSRFLYVNIKTILLTVRRLYKWAVRHWKILFEYLFLHALHNEMQLYFFSILFICIMQNLLIREAFLDQRKWLLGRIPRTIWKRTQRITRKTITISSTLLISTKP